MATVKPVMNGSGLSRNGGVLRYWVTGLENLDPSMMWSALFAGGLPQIGDPHPNAPQVGVQDVRVSQVVSSTSCFVDVVYAQDETTSGGGGGDDGLIEIDGNVVGIRTMMDYGGKSIDVIYNPTMTGVRPFNAECSRGQGDRCTVAEVDQYVGMMTLRITRKEQGHPGFKCRDYVGKLNATNFAYTGDKEAWLCTRIAGRRASSATLYDVTYEFQHTEDGWHKIAAYIDPTTGIPPSKNMGSITLNPLPPRVRMPNDQADQDRSRNGITIVRVQGSKDFSALSLPQL